MSSDITADAEVDPSWYTVSEASCCICGVSVIHEHHSPEWMSKFHTLYITGKEANSDTYVSFQGRRELFADVIRVAVGHTSWASQPFLRTILMPYDFQDNSQYTLVSSDTETTVLGFPFHSSCWKVLRASGRVSNKDIHLFNLCRSMPKQCGMLNWGHDYEGKAKQDVPLAPGEEPSLIFRPIGWNTDLDPGSHLQFVRMFKGETSKLPDGETGSIATLPKAHQVTDSDIFTRLPIEILLALAEHLTLNDLIRLKQSSRAFTNLCLPNSFWKNRFRPGGEFEYIFETHSHLSSFQGSWKSIYESVKRLLSDEQMARAMRNRKRVWDLCSPLHKTLNAMRQTSCDGIPIRSIFEPNAPPDDRTQRSWVPSSRVLKSPGEILDRGCRVIYERVMALPTAMFAIYASTIEAFGRCYICGIRIQGKDGTSYSLGFKHPHERRLLALQDEQLQISGFDLAHDQRGVRGLAVVYNHGTKSDWVGDYSGIPKRMLRCDPLGAGVVDSLKGGFDAMKLVALSVNAGRPIEDQPPTLQGLAMQTLWYPDIPQLGLIFLGLESVLEDHQRSASAVEQDLPVCFKLFGDSNAKNVDKLNNITILHRVRPEEVLGATELPTIEVVTARCTRSRDAIELGYRGTNRKFGSREYEREETLDIDGPGGERIESITTSRLERKLVGITVKTNRDRAGEFFGKESLKDSVEDMESSLVSAEGNTVVGFWAKMETELGFTDFGLVVCR